MDRDRRRPRRAWLGPLPRPGGGRRPRLRVRVPTRAQAAALGRRLGPWLLPLLAGALGASLAITFLAREDARVGPATVRLSARPALRGSSLLAVPPFGSMSARTHLGPMEFRATVDDVDVGRLGQLLDGRQGAGPGGQGGPRFAELEATLGPLERQARPPCSSAKRATRVRPMPTPGA